MSPWGLETQVRPKNLLQNITMPNNISSINYSLKSVPVPPDLEVLPLEGPEQKLIISGSYSLISGKAGIPH